MSDTIKINDAKVEFEKNKYGSDLINFLSNPNFTAEKGSDNVNIFSPVYGCKNIPLDKLNIFFDLLEKCRKNNLHLNFLEKQNKEYSGIVLDFDILQNNNESLIEDKHFNKITQRIMNVINLAVQLPSDIDTTVAIIKREKLKEVYEGDKRVYKEGFHIIIPGIKISRPLKRYIVDTIRNKGYVERILKHIDIVNKGDILDKNSAHFPAYFIGGAKPGKNPDKLYGIYNASIEDDEYVTITKLNEDEYPKNICWEFSINYEYDLVKKINYNCRPHIADKIQEYKSSDTSDDEIEKSLQLLSLTDPEGDLLKRYLDILPNKYYEEYLLWYKVLCAIANTNKEYKNIAEWFSKKSENKFNKDDFDRIWNDIINRVHDNPITMLSIKYWARTESPDKYDAINKESYYEYFMSRIYENDGDVGNYSIGKLLKIMFGDKFLVACNEGKPVWYEFVIENDKMKKGQLYKWRCEFIDGPSNLHIYISEKLPTLFNKCIDHMQQQQLNVDDKNLKDYYKNVIKNLKKSKRSLESNGFCSSTIKSATHLFRDYNFLDEVDQDEMTIGVGNGILSLGNRCKLIDGFHEHKISMSTGVNYIPYDENNPYIKELLRVVRDIIVEDDMFNFLMIWLASSLDNRIKKSFIIQLQSDGSNGKSFIAEMMVAVLGDYGRKLSKDIILKDGTRKGANGPTPAKMDAINKRFGYISETNPDDFLDSKKFKEIISGETQTGRLLFRNNINFKVNANILSISNYPFNIDVFDEGTWRRCRLYRCKMTFLEDREPSNKWEKKADPNIRHYNKKDEYKEAWLSILVHYYEIFMNEFDGKMENLKCETLDRETEIYRNKQDTINRFITEKCVITDIDYEIPVADIVKYYQEWYLANIGSGSKFKVSELIDRFTNSKIKKFVTRSENQELIAKGCRFINHDNPIEDHETYLCLI